MRRFNHSSRFIEMFGAPNSNPLGIPTGLVSDIFTLQMGKTPARDTARYWAKDGSGKKWISIADMSQYEYFTEDTEEYISDSAVKETGMRLIPEQTVIMSFKLTIGRVSVTSEPIFSNEAIVAFIPRVHVYNTRFLYYLVKFYDWLENAALAVKGKTLNKESIGKNRLIIPSIESQNEFASFAEQADKSKFSDFKSRFIEMFGNLESKKRLGDVASYINGFAFKPSDWSSTGLPIIRIQNLTGTNEIYNYYNGDYPDQVEVNNGDILISWSATLGVYVWTEGKALLNQHIFKVSFDKGYINRDYFIYAVTQKLDEMSTKTHGTTMRHIVKSDFDNTIIPFPSIEGQDRFALVAKQADKSKYLN